MMKFSDILPLDQWEHLAKNENGDPEWVIRGKLRKKDLFECEGMEVSIVWSGAHIEVYTGTNNIVHLSSPKHDPKAVLEEGMRIIRREGFGYISCDNSRSN